MLRILIFFGFALSVFGADSTTNYSAFPKLAYFTSGKIILVWSPGTDHAAFDHKLVKATSTDGGTTWSATSTIVSETGISHQNYNLGVVANNRAIIFYQRRSVAGFLSLQYIYSDDESATWSAPATISPGAFDIYAPNGKVINIASNQVLSAWNGRISGPSTNWTSHVNISSDFGSTWGANISVISSGAATTPNYSESCFAYLGNNTILGLVRLDSSSTMRQVLSTDNGNTWASIGNITFDTGANGMTPWLETFLSSGKPTVVCYYQDRTEDKVRAVFGYAADLISNGVSGWNAATRVNVASLVNGYAAGYSTATYPRGNQLGIGAYYDDTSEFSATISFFTAPTITDQVSGQYRTRRSPLARRR